jgi:hypothetical protein
MNNNDRTEPDGLEGRLRSVERAIARLSTEVTSQRLRIVDQHGRERIVAEVVGDTAELRVEVPTNPGGGRTHVLLFATPPGTTDIGDETEPWIGVALQVEGDISTALHP